MKTDLNQLLQPHPHHIQHMRLGSNEAKGLGLQQGDLLLIDTCISPKFGDVVVARIEGRWRPRLLKRISGRIILTANTFSTPDTHFETWDQIELLGVVAFSIHAHVQVAQRHQRAFLGRPSVSPTT